ncbi:MAG: beta-glucosidase [Thermoleophilaceae bacterium]
MGRGASIATAALLAALIAVMTLGVRPDTARAATQCPWLDASKPVNERAGELVAAMTLDDKIAMVHGDQIWEHYGMAGHVPANSRLCIPDLGLNDAGAGVGDFEVGTTAFPAGIAQAASWDPGLQTQFGRTLGWEAWQKGVNVQLAPGVNIARVPMNGRGFEYFGEDPYLSGQTAVAEIQGIQQNPVIATVKHYAANNQETNRMSASSDVSERTLHEIYEPAFEAAVKQGRVGAVMCSYNRVNSVYACENPTLLTGILKKEFGFDGFVMSDWLATHSTNGSALAGMDMEMPSGTYFGDPLKAAVQSGQVPVARLDDMVTRIARSMFRVGIFEHPAAAEPQAFAADVSTPDDVALARRVSEDGTVLLKNDGGVLPLDLGGKRIAVIGAAGGPGAYLAYGGGGSSHIPEAGFKPDVVTPYQGILQAGAAKGDLVTYADGTTSPDAVAAAKASDVAIVFASDAEAEGTDRSDLGLDFGACILIACQQTSIDQAKLITDVAQANPNTIVVLDTGGPVTMPWAGQVKGILEAWYPGQEDGNAIAALLFGQANPSGKLPETFPKSQGDIPTRTPQQYPGVNDSSGVPHVSYSEGLDVGYRWYDAQNIAPLFPFGYGLSYTTFRYSGLSASPGAASFTLTNTGRRAGAEVVQLYVGDPASSAEPPKQLKGYRKVWLEPGQSARVTLPLDKRSFAHWDDARHGWSVSAGSYRVLVGGSSRDLPLQGSVSVGAAWLGP